MKNLYFLLALLAFGFFPRPVYASHLAGGTIHVQQLDTIGNYIVYLSVTRDCNGIGLAHPILHARVSNSEIIDTLNSSHLIRIKDITGIGDSCSAQSKCNGGSFPYGMETHLYADTMNLGSLPACEVNIYYDSRIERYTSLTSPPPANQYFFVTATINKCLINSTPYFIHDVPQILGANQDQHLSYTARDTQDIGDSFSYELTSPLVGLGTNLTNWPNIIYTFYRPLSFLGYPNHLSPWPAGFRLNPNTGILRFRPVQTNQVSWFAVQVKEWRKINGVSTVISQITYDAMYIVISKPQQSMPVVNNLSLADEQSAVYLCSQDTFRMHLDVQDADGDSVFVKWDSLPAGSNLSVSYDSNSAAQIDFTWFPGSNSIRPQPYVLNLELRDQACPLANKANRSFSLIVQDSIPSPIVSIGPDTIRRNFGDSLRLSASISNQLNRAIRWSSSGDGHFTKTDTLFLPTYRDPKINPLAPTIFTVKCSTLVAVDKAENGLIP